MFKNPYLKNILLALAVTIFGYVLLNITFLLYAFLTMSVSYFLPSDFPMTHWWFPPLTLGAFIVIIASISGLIFRSKLKEIYKATYAIVPLAVVYVAIGIALFRWPVLAYGVNALIFGAVIFYLYKTKKSWLFYYATILFSLALLIFTLLGGQI